MKLFDNHFDEISTELDIAEICKKYRITNWSLNSDGTVDVRGSVYLSNKELTKLPLNFGRVEGNFSCSRNMLTSLVGCPNYVGGSFSCYDNHLTSLVGCPNYVGSRLSSFNNRLTSLVGSPDYIGGVFTCSNNNIRSFGGIVYIDGYFWCSGNPICVLWNLFRDTSKIETFNEWEVIQDNKVILYRLNDFLAEIGQDDVTEIQLNEIKKHYTIV